MVTFADIYPPFDLRVRCSDLELRGIRDDDIPEISELVLRGIHPAERMPFTFPWTDAAAEDIPRNMGQYYWGTRAGLSAEKWMIDLAVVQGDRIVGVQGMHSEDYPVTRSAETGSWLGREFQGRGIGTLMRQMVCCLLFDHLGAHEVTSGAYSDNPASLAVSRKVGCADNGTLRVQRRAGEVAVLRQLVLTPDRFARPAQPVEVIGAEPLRRALGIG